jgi:hypothetical protein
VFSSLTGVRFFPTFNGQFFSSTGSFVTYDVGGVPLLLMLGSLVSPVAGVVGGQQIDVSHFGTSAGSTAVNPGCNLCVSTDSGLGVVTDSRYGATNFTQRVPEPSTLLLLGAGMAVAGVRKRVGRAR